MDRSCRRNVVQRLAVLNVDGLRSAEDAPVLELDVHRERSNFCLLEKRFREPQQVISISPRRFAGVARTGACDVAPMRRAPAHTRHMLLFGPRPWAINVSEHRQFAGAAMLRTR
jgi:hypothetical protein